MAIVKKPVAAWEYRDALILAMPSSRGGNYLVGVKPTKDGRLAIVHRCTATVNHQRCWHMREAYMAYKAWRHWEPVTDRVVFLNQVINLNPEWKQILVPVSEWEELKNVQVSTA